MDAYLTKPLDRALLDESISRHLAPPAQGEAPKAAVPVEVVEAATAPPTKPARQPAADECAGAVVNAANASAPGQPVDWEKFIAAVDGDAEFAVELVQTFIESGDAVLRDIRDALQRGDATAVRQAAHALKGSSASMCAGAASEAAALLEAAARSGDLTELAALEARLRSETGRAIDYMRARQA